MIVAGRYRLLRRIGRGAMGEVWAAHNDFTGREVALKFISASGEDVRRRLRREALACGALRHRNVIDIHDLIHADNGDPVLVLELLRGETLAELLRRRRRLEPALAALIGRDIAAALAAVHALSIVHRDLKPANIFLHRESDGGPPVVKVLDFGVSKRLEGAPTLCTAPGHAIGSVAYMSPEQIRTPASVDPRTDIWALGVVLFEMLAGQRPFRGEASAQLLQILQGEIPPLTRFVRHIDPRLVDVVAGCLSRSREARLGPAERIAEALDRLVPAGGDPWALPAAEPPSRPRPELPSITMVSTEGAGGQAPREDIAEIDDDDVPTRQLPARPRGATAPLPMWLAPTCLAPPPPSSVALPSATPGPGPAESFHPVVSPAPASRPRPALVAIGAGVAIGLVTAVILSLLLLAPEPGVAREMPRIHLPAPSGPQVPPGDAPPAEQERPESVSDTPRVPASPSASPSASPPPAPKRVTPRGQPPLKAAPPILCDKLRFLERRKCETDKSKRF